ncbi:MAG: cadherin-like beta sandwich domain-containing protein, partial [Bacilli bacterium]|nr:cadherin-like beta sandwich domain-containing protein [Bacilli bacterium]
MRKKFKIITSILLVIGILFAQMPVALAAGSAAVTLSANSTTPTVGGTVEITVGIKDITNATNGVMGFQANVSYDSSILEIDETKQTAIALSAAYADDVKTIAGLSFNPATNIKTASSGIIKLTFKVKAAGTTTIRVTNPEITAGNSEILSSGDASITINPAVPVPKSTNANLKSLSINGYTFNETFDKDVTKYTVTVPHNVSSVTINAAAEDTKAKSISNTGNKTLLAAGQKSTFTVTCTAEDGTTKKSYVVEITREAAPVTPSKSSDNTLKGLGVSGYTMSPAFNKNTTSYSVTVPHDATEVSIDAEKNDSAAKVEISGNTNLKDGENIVTVKVTAENGEVKTYTIKVNRESVQAPVVTLDDDATLKSLNASGYTLSPKFSKDTNVYSMTVDENINGLNIDAIPNSSKAKVEISGNKNWKAGVNNVSIVVTAENGNKNTYIINVTKKTTEEKPVEKSQNNYLKSLSISGASIKPGFDKDVS